MTFSCFVTNWIYSLGIGPKVNIVDLFPVGLAHPLLYCCTKAPIGDLERAAVSVMNDDEFVEYELRVQEQKVPNSVSDIASGIPVHHDHCNFRVRSLLRESVRKFSHLRSPVVLPTFMSTKRSTLQRGSIQATKQKLLH